MHGVPQWIGALQWRSHTFSSQIMFISVFYMNFTGISL